MDTRFTAEEAREVRAHLAARGRGHPLTLFAALKVERIIEEIRALRPSTDYKADDTRRGRVR